MARRKTTTKASSAVKTGVARAKATAQTVKETVAEVKVAEKTAAGDAKEAAAEIFIQYQGNESTLATVTEKIKRQYVEEGHEEGDIKSLKIYLKPEDASAYYVINENNSGKVFLF